MTTLLTVKEAAARARVSEPIVRGWIRDGLLPHYRLGAKGRRGKIAVAAEDLDSLLASFRVAAVPTKVTRNATTPKPLPTSPKPVLKHLRLK
jgi:excisionase family DNA binding protein